MLYIMHEPASRHCIVAPDDRPRLILMAAERHGGEAVWLKEASSSGESRPK